MAVRQKEKEAGRRENGTQNWFQHYAEHQQHERTELRIGSSITPNINSNAIQC